MAKKKNYELCATMDCDRTHNPYYLKRMLSLIQKDYAIINTNRFKTFNSLQDWSLFRKMLTQIRFFFVKVLLNTNFDSSGGLRIYNLKKIYFKHFFLSRNNSYFFLIESLFYFEKLNYKIFEIPIILKKRTYEKSKMNVREVLNSLFFLIKLRFCKKNKIYSYL